MNLPAKTTSVTHLEIQSTKGGITSMALSIIWLEILGSSQSYKLVLDSSLQN